MLVSSPGITAGSEVLAFAGAGAILPLFAIVFLLVIMWTMRESKSDRQPPEDDYRV